MKTALRRWIAHAHKFFSSNGRKPVSDTTNSHPLDSIDSAVNKLFDVARLVLADETARVEVFHRAEEFGVHLLPCHFYSPIPQLKDLDSKEDLERPISESTFSLDTENQRKLLLNLGSFSSELSDVLDSDSEGRFHWNNGAFGPFDSMAYYALIRKLQPKKIIEIGSGYSTQIASRAIGRNGAGQLTCIEPFPRDFLARLGNIQLLKSPVQQIEPSIFDSLSENDVLFIDSTHVSKFASDVNHIFFQILPRIKPGVWIHFHDIFLPFDYPISWLNKGLLFWNEQYLLNAFLSFNPKFQVRLSNQFWRRTDPDFVRSCSPILNRLGPIGAGSFWIQRVS